MEFSPKEHRQPLSHAGDIPTDYVVERRNELLEVIIKQSKWPVPGEETEKFRMIADNFEFNLNTFMGYCDSDLYVELCKVSTLVATDDSYPDIVDVSVDLPFTDNARAVLTGAMFAYYSSTNYLFEEVGIEPVKVNQPRIFYPKGTSMITADSMAERGMVLSALGSRVYDGFSERWEPAIGQFPEVMGGPEKLDYVKIGVGYATDRVHDLNKDEITKHNKKFAKNESIAAGKMLDGMSTDEIIRRMSDNN